MKKEINKKKIKFHFELMHGYNSCLYIQNEYYSIKDFSELRIILRKINCRIILINNNTVKFLLQNFYIKRVKYNFKGKITFIFCHNFLNTIKLLNQYHKKNNKDANYISGIIFNKKLDIEQIIELSRLKARKDLKKKILSCIISCVAKIATIIKKTYFNIVFCEKSYIKNISKI